MAEAVLELKETEFKDLYEKERESQEDGTFVRECQLDTDMELLIPDDYVNNIEERLRLYQELDAIEDEAALDAFGEALADRFGDLPVPVQELLKSMHLRWLAQRLGFEKIVLKQGKFIGYFISNQDSAYYQSEQFNRMLQFLKDYGKQAQMKQRNNRLSLTIEGVTSILQALRILRPVLVMHAEQRD